MITRTVQPGEPALRVGVDVGGTFTKAVAVDPGNGELRAAAEVPTTHTAGEGVTEGVAAAIEKLLADLGAEGDRVVYVAFSTTQAMNALLEGDVARVGVVGIGRVPDLRVARRRTRIGDVELAPGRKLQTEHEFIDATGGLSPADVDRALKRLAAASCEAVAISGAFSVDGPGDELLIAERARLLGLPSCCGHELSGAYGLETRTVSAAINAAILPVVERTAGVVERALADAGIDVPLLVLRGDGGAMSTEAFRLRPSFTVGSGPAAGVAAALQALGLSDALVLECGGTSSNVSVVSGGRPVLRSIRVMGRPTAIRSIDSWVVGAAGGSMARLGRRSIAETGPRSAHVAGLPYTCFSAAPAERDGEIQLVSPLEGDPGSYAVLETGEGRMALTATCAANALGLVPADAHARGDREAARRSFDELAAHVRGTGDDAARAVLDGAVRKVAEAGSEAARQHRLGPEVPVVALGGAADVLAPEVARRLGRELLRPPHPEVLSAIGAAISLVRAEVCRSARAVNGNRHAHRIELVGEAERECVAAGAAPATVSVETSYEPAEGLVRAVATGAVALEADAARRHPASAQRQLRAAADALAIAEGELSMIAASDFYRVYSENGSGRVAVVDALGGIACSERGAREIVTGRGPDFLERLERVVERTSISLGISSMLPRVTVLCGSTLLDLTDARDPSEIAVAAERTLREHDDAAVAVVAR
jgi:N-methylhydantoinase A/oxoprolinase/acetone carboxylase beta subunit